MLVFRYSRYSPWENDEIWESASCWDFVTDPVEAMDGLTYALGWDVEKIEITYDHEDTVGWDADFEDRWWFITRRFEGIIYLKNGKQYRFEATVDYTSYEAAEDFEVDEIEVKIYND